METVEGQTACGDAGIGDGAVDVDEKLPHYNNRRCGTVPTSKISDAKSYLGIFDPFNHVCCRKRP